MRKEREEKYASLIKKIPDEIRENEVAAAAAKKKREEEKEE